MLPHEFKTIGDFIESKIIELNKFYNNPENVEPISFTDFDKKEAATLSANEPFKRVEIMFNS